MIIGTQQISSTLVVIITVTMFAFRAWVASRAWAYRDICSFGKNVCWSDGIDDDDDSTITKSIQQHI